MIRALTKKSINKITLLSEFYRFFIICFMLFSVFLYVAIYTHVPISLQLYQTYDDALFIKLGENMAKGDWLGQFNQLTLVKGAGYPIFLALASWAGASVTFTQALFYAAAAVLLWSVTYKITRSRLFATLVFLLVLFNPNAFQERILRESIYTSQTILVLCLSWLTLFGCGERGKMLIPVTAGLMLGWLWITREEGVWIIPGIATLFLARSLRYSLSGSRPFEVFYRASLYLAGAIFLIFIVKLINFTYYKAFVVVDVKDPSFIAAMQQLQRVHVGAGIPYVPLSKESRERLYELSPDFAILKPTLDPSVGSNPSVGSECWIWPSACHDFSAGQFFWQVRNGAAKAGKFSSESEARSYFRQLALQVEKICERKEVPCYKPSIIAMMPHLYEVQLKSVWPDIVSAWHLLLQTNSRGWIDAQPSDGGQSELEAARGFLNYPLSTAVVSPHASVTRLVTMSGWFLDDANGWFALDTPAGVRASVIRLASPDIARLFPKALTQRFQINLGCGSSCEVKFVSQGGDVFNFNPDSLPKLHSVIPYGHSVIAFDSATIKSATIGQANAVVLLSRKFRVDVYKLYSVIVAPLFYLGLFSLVIMVVFYPKRMLSSEAFIFFAAIAILILSRSAILLLINVSSFPSLTPAYFSPALCLLPVCSMFAIWSVIDALLSSVIPPQAS